MARKPKLPHQTFDVTVKKLGGRGDGLAEGHSMRFFVPFSLPGDHVTVKVTDKRGDGYGCKVVQHISKGPGHQQPPCPHYAKCGGCSLQHLDAATYDQFKVDHVTQAFARQGLGGYDLLPLWKAEPNSRRRVKMQAQSRREGIMLGFTSRRSHDVVAIKNCPLLVTAFNDLLEPLKAFLGETLPSGGRAEVFMAENVGGIDLSIHARDEADLKVRQAAVDFANAHNIARISWKAANWDEAEPLLERDGARVDIAGVPVPLAAEGFLQPGKAGEEAIAAMVTEAAQGATKALDLFCGAGSMTIPLNKICATHGVDSAAFLLESLRLAANANSLNQLTVEDRNLFRRPYQPKELKAYDVVVFDPPRAGAKEQAPELAQSDVETIIAVSCNPSTMARDIRALVDGGYSLKTLRPFDQFLWSPHVEAVAVLKREG